MKLYRTTATITVAVKVAASCEEEAMYVLHRFLDKACHVRVYLIQQGMIEDEIHGDACNGVTMTEPLKEDQYDQTPQK